MNIPTDALAARFPISIKGVIFVEGKVVLLRNERGEWELPGGKLEAGEDPPVCLRREIHEELSISVEIGRLIDCWLYNILGKIEVFIATYGCRAPSSILHTDLVISHEHKELGCFALDRIAQLPMPAGYRRSILSWHRDCGD